jgi:hypothetical protein
VEEVILPTGRGTYENGDIFVIFTSGSVGFYSQFVIGSRIPPTRSTLFFNYHQAASAKKGKKFSIFSSKNLILYSDAH